MKKQWEDSLASRLQDLADILHINEILSQIPASIDQLLLVPHRYLHLFPLHALPIDSENCLLNRFSRGVRYTPSCQLLQQVQQQPRLYFQRFFAIQTPTEDLYAPKPIYRLFLYF